MPWTEKDAGKHKSGLSKRGNEKWASVANAVLDKCMKESANAKDCEIMAIMHANKMVNENDILDEADRICNIRIRQNEPSKYEEYKVLPLNEDIKIIYGFNKFQPAEIQSILFSKKKYDESKAVEWAKAYNFKVDVVEGGAGSGNYGHAGRPGELGGSGEGGGGQTTASVGKSVLQER